MVNKTIKGQFSYVINKILNFAYPDKCIVCNKIIYDTLDFAICRYCIGDFYIFDREICENNFEKNKGFSMFLYTENIRKLIHAFKYDDCGYYAKVLGIKMGEFFMKQNLFSADLIIPVPIHKKRRRKRGFNQSDILAKEFSRVLGIPVDYNSLVRKKNTIVQFGLNKEERIENLKDAFMIVNKEKLIGKSIIIIDDIYTTGATINECRKTIQSIGVQEIYYFTLSSTNDIC